MSTEINLIVTWAPKAGKEEEIKALFDTMSSAVHANEPGCLTYYSVKAEGQDEMFIVEKYANQEALDVHGKTDHYLKFKQEVGPLLAGPSVVKKCVNLSGFARR